MTVKLKAIDRWREAGFSIPLPGKRREITLQVNVEKTTKFTVMQDARQTLLRVVEPWECPLTIKFVVEGDCAVVPDSLGEVWWMSDDGDILSFDVLTESFTELEQRMEITPEMEITLLKADVRKEQRRREVAELLLAKKQRDEAAAANADPETGEVHDETEKPADPDTGAADGSDNAADSAAPKPKG